MCRSVHCDHFCLNTQQLQTKAHASSSNQSFHTAAAPRTARQGLLRSTLVDHRPLPGVARVKHILLQHLPIRCDRRPRPQSVRSLLANRSDAVAQPDFPDVPVNRDRAKMAKKAKSFSVGDLVFAKVKGYPPWPAKVGNWVDWAPAHRSGVRACACGKCARTPISIIIVHPLNKHVSIRRLPRSTSASLRCTSTAPAKRKCKQTFVLSRAGHSYCSLLDVAMSQSNAHWGNAPYEHFSPTHANAHRHTHTHVHTRIVATSGQGSLYTVTLWILRLISDGGDLSIH